MKARRFLWLLVTLALAACSLGGNSPANTPTELPTAGVTQTLVPTLVTGGAGIAPAPVQPSELPPPQVVVTNPTETLDDSPVVGPAAEETTPTLRRLTDGGCCVQPFWSADSRTVLFLDRPDPAAPVGYYGVNIDGGAPQLVFDRLGIYSRDLQLRAYLESGQTVIERIADGQRWVIDNGGRSVSFSPGGGWVAWTLGQSGPPFDTARREIWISRPDGSEKQQVYAGVSGGFSGWISDERILVSGRPDDAEDTQVLWSLALPVEGSAPGALTELARARRIRSTVVSPGGGWVVYLVTFSDDPAEDGLWLLNTATGERRKLEMFGAYRWRDEGRLLMIPQELGQPSNRLWQIETAGGPATPLTDPAVTPFRIAGGDWSVSPDGQSIVFVSAEDNNLWLLDLP